MNARVAFNILRIWIGSKFDKSLHVLYKVTHRSKMERSSSFVVDEVNVNFVNSTEQENCRYSVVPLGRTVVNCLLA